MATQAPVSGRRFSTRELLRELALIAVFFLAYKFGRVIVAERVHAAFTNADGLWHLERWMRLPDEAALQGWLLQWPDILRAANEFYVGVHFPLTAVFLLWAWFFRPRAEYFWARNLLAVMTAGAFVLHILVPLAPPRMLPQLGFVDTMATIGPSAYGENASKIANEYAAMPSLHVGWALLIGVFVVVTLQTRWRWLAMIHPAATLAVVTVTANHWWLDSVVAGLLLVLALAVCPPSRRFGRARGTAPEGAEKVANGSSVARPSQPITA